MHSFEKLPVDPFLPSIPPTRRLAWESLGDIRKINTLLLGLCLVLAFICAIEGGTVWVLVRRSPHIITQDEGYLQWRTTEAFILHPPMLHSYLTTVMHRLLNVVPGDYHLEPLIALDVAPEILAAFNGEATVGESIRMERNMRQLFQVLDIRQIEDARFPHYHAFLIRGEETVYGRTQPKTQTSSSHALQPSSRIMFFTVYLERRRPRPENPWGLALVGIRNWESEAGAAQWTKAKPFETSFLFQ